MIRFGCIENDSQGNGDIVCLEEAYLKYVQDKNGFAFKKTIR